MLGNIWILDANKYPMRSRLIITIPHFNNPSGLMLTIGSINETFPIDVIVVDDGENIFNERLAVAITKTQKDFLNI